VYGPSKAFYIAEGGQLAVGVPHPLSTRERGFWLLSPKVYDISDDSCALGERSLLFQRYSIKKTALKCISHPRQSLMHLSSDTHCQNYVLVLIA